MSTYRMPDGKLYSFPDEMPKEEIRQIASKKFPNQIPPRDDLLTTAGKGISTFVPATQYAYEAGRTLAAETALDFLDPRFEEAYAIREGQTPEERKIPVAPSVMKPGAPVEEYLNQPAPISMPAWSPGQYLPEEMKLAIAKNAATLSVGSQLQARKALAETPKANVAPGSFDEFAFNLAAAVPDIGIGLAAGVAAVPTRGASLAAVAPYFAAKAGGPKYAEARKAGLSHDQALGAAVVVGAAEAATEALSGLIFGAKLGGSLLGTVVRTGAVEGLTEGATEGINILVDMGILRQDMTLEEAMSRLQMAAAVGTVGGGTVGGAIRLATGPGVRPDDKVAPTTEKIVETDFGAPAGVDPGIAETLGNVAAQPLAIEREKRLALPPPSAIEDIVSPIAERQQTIKVMPTEEQLAQKASDRTRAVIGAARETATPIGTFSLDEVGPDVRGKIVSRRLRQRTGRQPDDPVSVAEMQAVGVGQSFIDALIIGRKPLTGEQLTAANRPSLESRAVPAGPFTEEQYSASVAATRNAKRFSIDGVRKAAISSPRVAKLIRDEMVTRGDLVPGTRPGTFKPYERPAAPATQSPLKTFTVAPVASDTIAVKKDGKVIGVFEDQVAVKNAVRGIREREKAEQNPPSRVEVVRGGVDAEGKALDGRPGFAVYENRYDAEGKLVDRAIVSTHVAEDTARAEAENFTARGVAPPRVRTGPAAFQEIADEVTASRASARAQRPSVIARSRPQKIPTPKVLEGRVQEVVDKLNEQANKRALPLIGNRVLLTGTITDAAGNADIEGSYLKQLTTLAVDRLDPDMSTDDVVEALAGVMDHETVHALREAGVLAPGTKAWSILSNYVVQAKHPDTGLTYIETAIDRNPDLADRPDVIVEEAIAEAFRAWAANRRSVAGVPRTALEKIVEWFKRLVSSVPDDVFRSIETGTLARSRIKAPLSYRGAAVEKMEKARADLETATTPEQTLAAEREFLQAREQAAEDRVGRVGPRSVLGTTPSDEFMTGPRASFDRVEALLENAKTTLNKAPSPNRGTPDNSFLMKLADAYDKAPHEPSNTAVGKAYSSLVAETKSFFNALNITVVPWRENGQPYLNQRELIDDMADNGQVKMRLSNDLFPPHPSRRNHPMQEPSGFTTEDGSSLSNGDLLRVVAEAYGYAPVGAVPSMLGDYRAYSTIKDMYSPQGQRALATEMLAQSAWQNTGPKMRLTDGSIAPPDALGFVPPNMREFAEQKATLLPAEVLVEPVQPREDILDMSGIGDETRYSRSARNPQVDTPQFKRWFGNSKVVGPDGQPLVVYHGSEKDFSTFSKDSVPARWRDKERLNGFFFSADSQYGYIQRSSNVYPVFLRIENPYFIDRSEKMEGLNAWDSAAEWIDGLRSQGYDGIIWGDPDNLRKPPRGAWGDDRSQIFVFDNTQIKSATGNIGTFDPTNPDIRYSRGMSYGPAEKRARDGERGYALGNLAPLAGAPQVEGASGPDPRLVAVAEQYASDNSITLRRQAEYVEVDPVRAKRIADAYEAMTHTPNDPAVNAAYKALIDQTVAQYRALEKAGYKFWFIDPNTAEGKAYASSPWNAMRDLRANQSMGSFPTVAGFGTKEDFNPAANPLLTDTGIRWPFGSPTGPAQPVLANDLFRAVHDAFGHGIEGAGFRAQGEENAWQAHSRLFYGDAVGAITTETRGQNSWLNYGPFGEQNRKASAENTVFADQKTGLMPEWTWLEGRAGDMGELTADKSYNVGSPEFYAMLDEVVPGGKYYGNPKRSAAAVTSPADTSSPAFSQTRDGNAFFGGDIAYQQLQMARDGDRGAVLTYLHPEDFLRLANTAPVREQDLYTAAANDGLKFNTMPSLVVESGKVGAVPVLNSDGVGMARALLGKAKSIPVVLYPSGKGQIENVDTLTANGNVVDMLGMYEFDISRRGPRQGLSTVAFNSWFKQSTVVDETGAPKRVYDTTAPDSYFGVFDTQSSEFRSHFGTVEQASEISGGRGTGYPTYLSIQNPLRLEDDGSFKTDAVAKQMLNLGVIDAALYDDVVNNTVNGSVALQDAAADAGYDGVVYRTAPDAPENYITFQPTQAKAAVADRGTWSAAGSDIRYSRGRPRARVTPHGGMVYRNIYDRVQGWFSQNIHNLGRSKKALPLVGSIFDLRINFQDNFLPIKEYYDELVRKGLPIPADLNAYIVEQSVGSAAAFQVQQRERQFVEPLTKAMKEGIKAKRFTYDDMIDFLYALHAPERNAYLLARGSKKPDPSGMTDAAAAKIIADAKAKGTFTDLMAISRMADDIVADINQTRLATGQITADVLAASPFRHWVPLRDTEDVDPHDDITNVPRADGVGRGFTSWGKRPDKRMFGRTSKAGDILANLVALQAVTVMRGERARVGKALVATIRQAQAAGVSSSISILKQYPKRLAYGADGMIREIVDQNFRKDPRYLVFKVDGKEVVLATDDAYISTALRSPMIEQFGKLMQIMMSVRRTYTALITSRNPNFVLTNFVRDAQEALINATQYDVKNLIPKMVASIPQAAIAISEYQLNQKAPPGSGKMTRHYEEMVQNGWIVSFLAPTDMANTINKLRRDAGALEGSKAVVAKAGQAVDYALAKWDGLNNVAEGTMRLGLYSAMRDAGASITEAGVAAKNLTINFNKGGKYKQLMDTGYLFASVVTNGMAVAGSALKSKSGLGILTGVIGMAVVLDALNRAASDDEDENGVKDYDQMSEDELARNIILPVHKFGIPGITQPLKIPMAIGVYGAIFNLGRNVSRAIDSMTNPRQPIKVDGAMGRAVTAMVGALSPIGNSSNPAVLVSPWFVDPLVELMSNKNWADMDIVPPTYDETKPMSERFYRTTDATFVWAAQTLNGLTGGNSVRKGSFDFSPEHLQYWFEFATAGTGKFVLDAKYMLTDAPAALLAGEEVDLGKIPVIKRFVTGTSTRRGAQDLYYEIEGEVKTTENELEDRDLRAAGKTRIAASSRVRSAFDRADRQLKDLRKKLRTAMDNKTMTQTARLKKVSDIRDDMTEVMNRAVSAYYDEAEKKAKLN